MSREDTIKVILADDHALVRAGIRSLVNGLKNTEIVAEADNGREAVELTTEFEPDIVFLDIAMKELNGLDAAEKITRSFPEIKVIILSMYANEEYVLQALKAGACGYLLKDSAPNELEIAINAVMKGAKYMSPVISKHVIDDYLNRITGAPLDVEDTADAFQILTPRQREILQLIAEGNSTKEIAVKLNVSFKTVETHRTQLMKKLGINDVAGLVRYAIKTGIISSD